MEILQNRKIEQIQGSKDAGALQGSWTPKQGGGFQWYPQEDKCPPAPGVVEQGEGRMKGSFSHRFLLAEILIGPGGTPQPVHY